LACDTTCAVHYIEKSAELPISTLLMDSKSVLDAEITPPEEPAPFNRREGIVLSISLQAWGQRAM